MQMYSLSDQVFDISDKRSRVLLAIFGFIIALAMLSDCKSAQQHSADFEIVPRAAWGAVEPNLDATEEQGLFDPLTNPEGWMVYEQPLEQELTTIAVHHSALPLSDGPAEIQYKHMQQRGFADIGYHFIIDEIGRIYEGRRITTRGAHTGGHNTGTVGIVLLGNFEAGDPTAAQLDSLRALIKNLVEEYAIANLAGHRDFQPDMTVCPGENLWVLLPRLADELGLEFGIEGYQGP